MGIWSGLIATPQRTPLKSRPSLTLYFLLAGAFLLTLVPQVVQFPVWITVLIIAAMALRSFIEVYRLPLPSSTFCGIVAVILFGLIWVQYDTIMGRSAGTAVTAGLLAIKFYEIRAPRDIALIIFSCFFVVMSSLLFSQAVELFTYCLIMMWVLTAVLMRVHAGDRGDDNLLRMLSRSGLIFLQCVPLALLLFFFFPRIEGPIGLTLNDPPIGLTDTVAPGSVSKLARDDTPAMYVSFIPAGTYPEADTMYWRAIVLYQYRNGVFTSGKISNFPRKPAGVTNGSEKPPREAEHTGPHIDQIVTVYANNQIWLYALDVPITAPTNMAGYTNWANLYTDDTVRLANSNGKLDHLARYFVTSSPARPEETINDAEWSASRLLPTAKEDGPISPQVKALADQLWTEGQGTTDGYIYAVLRYFHHGGFVYSIDLPPQAPDWLTDFLIHRKTGYCEHFAAAFAVLMRLHEVPTRLVTGYVGGEFNPYDGDYVVRESSAHAWDEVWKPTDPTDWNKRLTGRWTRYDPTAFVSGADASAQAGNAAGDSPLRVIQRAPTFADSFLPAWVRSGLHEVQLRRDQMEMTWDNVVLSYDTESQFRLAKVLGFGGMNPVVELGLICLLAAATCAIALWRWLAHQPGITPVEFLYAAFCRNMARRGVPRATWEGPLAYTERVAEAFPDDLPALRSVGAIVARTRYGPKPADAQAIERLESALARISAAQAAGVRERK